MKKKHIIMAKFIREFLKDEDEQTILAILKSGIEPLFSGKKTVEFGEPGTDVYFSIRSGLGKHGMKP